MKRCTQIVFDGCYIFVFVFIICFHGQTFGTTVIVCQITFFIDKEIPRTKYIFWKFQITSNTPCINNFQILELNIFDSVNTIRMNEGIDKVVLSGGVFQNKYLLEGAIQLLKKNNFTVYSHATVPCNDGGIALGQLAVAAKRRELKCG